MPDAKGDLYLYEALELRGEYDARIKDIRDVLPEQSSKDQWPHARDVTAIRRPAPGLDAPKLREAMRGVERRRIMLNNAIQKANFEHEIEHQGERMTLARALEERRALNLRLAELHATLVWSSTERVIFKEDRDIVEPSPISFTECFRELDETRKAFREMNRRLREAAYRITVEFRDEP